MTFMHTEKPKYLILKEKESRKMHLCSESFSQLVVYTRSVIPGS